MSFKDWAKTPPMGWNSWDCFDTSINEDELLGNARFIAENLKAYGWEYVVCDIQWSNPTAWGHDYQPFTELETDEYSRLIPAPNRFPSSAGGKGFKPIADKIHAMGLKFGIHIMRGIPRQAVHRNTQTVTPDVTARSIAQSFSVCKWNTDMYGIDANKKGAQEYYDSIIDLYASWGVDYIKCDDIANTEFSPLEPYSASREIEMLRSAIDRCGREIVLSLSPGPAPIENAEHLSANANLWRMTGDFWDGWQQLRAMFELCEKWQPYVGTGNWPDCDMLPLGKLCVHTDKRDTRFTLDEQITMLTLWSIFRSPLMIGADLRECDEKTLELLTNQDVCTMLRTLTHSEKCYQNEDIIAWHGESDCYRYTAVFNVGENEIIFNEKAEEIKLESKSTLELWTKETFDFKNDVVAPIRPHSAKLYRQKKSRL